MNNAIPPQTIAGSPLGALLPTSLFSIPMDVNISTETAKRGTGPGEVGDAVCPVRRRVTGTIIFARKVTGDSHFDIGGITFSALALK